MLITFEGIDGCGKTSQASGLAERLGAGALLLREPGGTELGERLREILKDPSIEIDPRAELLLFCAARAELVEQVMRPALAAGKTVICDRYTDSTLAYQGYARGLGADLVATLNGVATAGLVPDLTLLMEISPQRAAARISGSDDPQRAAADRFEDEGMAFQESIAAAYGELANLHPGRIKRIDADREIEPIAEEIDRLIAEVRGG